MTEIEVQIRRLRNFPQGWELPSYATAGAAAVDLRNAGPELVLEPMERALVPTGLAIAVPSGFEAQVRPRSGLSSRRGIGLVNSPGTIDSDYRGELLLPVVNLDRSPQRVEHGERVAQMVVAPVARVAWREVDELSDTERAAGGFGSTGTR